MGVRRKSRELALKLLYRIDLTGETWDTLRDSLPVYGGSDKVQKFAVEITEGVILNKEKLDTMLDEAAVNWKVSRMAVLDRTILRMALAEHLIIESAPAAVIIDEAVDLATKFSTEGSGPFVNGILDSLFRAHPRE